MKLQDIYTKPIDRSIEGVIKADDASALRLEVEEYVLTNEVAQRLSSFLDAYNNYSNANGVWISGFFGSGKSHLLKILSILLENKEIDDTKALDIFVTKCQDEFLKAEIQKAASLPSQSILFNIDQKADVISKTEIDALLSVFVKVFDEMCGYYGKQGHIAQFERDLDNRNQYKPFKDAFRTHSDKEWETGREQAILESSNIAKSYAEVMGGDAVDYKDILGKYRSEYKVSIEDFADQVWSYIQTKEKNFRLNFFVDEVGQYIADNIKLMTNLQTIAESLATKCRGQAWVIVTAQEDMSNVIGEMDKQQGNDFSKIQARFANKMKLTSQDVAEVIQRRLLDKLPSVTPELSSIYDQYSNDFRTLFDFVDGSQTYRNYKDKEHFINCYPFIPYQFTLFQAAIQNLSVHNAFEGRHSSVGERSMLGVFQQVAIQLNQKEIGALATFDMMFDGISSALKSQIQKSILKADKNLPDEYAVSVLKALFLVKYVKEFKPTLTNICILMHDRIDRDTADLRKTVEAALNLLEQQTYIRRNGVYYEFLTDEEKDIEQEIKNTDVDPGAESEELARIVFDDVIKEGKIKYDQNGQYYRYARKLDDSLHGNRDYELTIHVISPFDERAGNQNLLRSHNMGRDELMVIMGTDERLLRDISMYLRTEKYIRQNTKIAQQASVTRILQEKREQNNQRKQDILISVKKLLEKAKLMAHGTDLEIGTSDPQLRVINGFQELVTMTYPQLKMLKDITYREDGINKYLNPSDSLFAADTMNMDEAETEILGFVTSQTRMGVRTTLKSTIDTFEKKPYGWYQAAIQCIVAKLNTRGKIECRTDSNILEGIDLERAIKNTSVHANLVLKPQQEFTASQLRQVKEFFEEFFDLPTAANEPKTLGHEVSAQLAERYHELDKLLSQRHDFPFLKVLEPAIVRLKELSGKPYSYYISEISSYSDELLDIKDTVIQPIESFMSGEKKRIYQDAKKFIQKHEHDFGYINGRTSIELREILDADDCYKGEKIRAAKDLHATLLGKLESYLKDMKVSKVEALEGLQSKLTGSEKYQGLSEPERESFDHSFTRARQQIDGINSIPVLESSFTQFERGTYLDLLTKLEATGRKETAGASETAPQAEIIAASRVRVSYDKPLLGSEDDVNDYVEKYKEALMAEIKSGKKVQV